MIREFIVLCDHCATDLKWHGVVEEVSDKSTLDMPETSCGEVVTKI